MSSAVVNILLSLALPHIISYVASLLAKKAPPTPQALAHAQAQRERERSLTHRLIQATVLLVLGYFVYTTASSPQGIYHLLDVSPESPSFQITKSYRSYVQHQNHTHSFPPSSSSSSSFSSSSSSLPLASLPALAAYVQFQSQAALRPLLAILSLTSATAASAGDGEHPSFFSYRWDRSPEAERLQQVYELARASSSSSSGSSSSSSSTTPASLYNVFGEEAMLDCRHCSAEEPMHYTLFPLPSIALEYCLVFAVLGLATSLRSKAAFRGYGVLALSLVAAGDLLVRLIMLRPGNAVVVSIADVPLVTPLLIPYVIHPYATAFERLRVLRHVAFSAILFAVWYLRDTDTRTEVEIVLDLCKQLESAIHRDHALRLQHTAVMTDTQLRNLLFKHAKEGELQRDAITDDGEYKELADRIRRKFNMESITESWRTIVEAVVDQAIPTSSKSAATAAAGATAATGSNSNSASASASASGVGDNVAGVKSAGGNASGSSGAGASAAAGSENTAAAASEANDDAQDSTGPKSVDRATRQRSKKRFG